MFKNIVENNDFYQVDFFEAIKKKVNNAALNHLKNEFEKIDLEIKNSKERLEASLHVIDVSYRNKLRNLGNLKNSRTGILNWQKDWYCGSHTEGNISSIIKQQLDYGKKI